jgi:hypothetical protein
MSSVRDDYIIQNVLVNPPCFQTITVQKPYSKLQHVIHWWHEECQIYTRFMSMFYPLCPELPCQSHHVCRLVMLEGQVGGIYSVLDLLP